MNSTSSANSSVSTAAIIGGGGGSVNNVVLDDFHFPSDLISIQDRKDEAMLGLFLEGWQEHRARGEEGGAFCSLSKTDLGKKKGRPRIRLKSYSSIAALKTDLMAALNKEVKSLDDDNWKFEGPRSHIKARTASLHMSVVSADSLWWISCHMPPTSV
ncbi:hypothetical protein POTOM_013676 [Populus tomentosa]|uniref:Uncharacterized protein n=1 Tax=Populus tomentosa TaxID=118781 RepID=A0A8X8D9J7_POPTO|nr:hypothetical protein POTOM_013676 [Populus tomentosa]